MKESDAKRKELKRMATGASPKGTRLAPVLEDSVRQREVRTTNDGRG